MMGGVSENQLTRILGDWQGGQVGGPGRAAAPGYARLAAATRALLLDARVPSGARLPAERRLAAALGVSRTPVAAAHRLLGGGGDPASPRGSGRVPAPPPGGVAPRPPWGPAGAARARAPG